MPKIHMADEEKYEQTILLTFPNNSVAKLPEAHHGSDI